MTIAICITVAVALLAVYALGARIMLTVGLAMTLRTDKTTVERIEYLAWRWPLVLIGVVR